MYTKNCFICHKSVCIPTHMVNIWYGKITPMRKSFYIDRHSFPFVCKTSCSLHKDSFGALAATAIWSSIRRFADVMTHHGSMGEPRVQRGLRQYARKNIHAHSKSRYLDRQRERERERDSGDALPRNIYIYIYIYKYI